MPGGTAKGGADKVLIHHNASRVLLAGLVAGRSDRQMQRERCRCLRWKPRQMLGSPTSMRPAISSPASGAVADSEGGQRPRRLQRDMLEYQLLPADAC